MNSINQETAINTSTHTNARQNMILNRINTDLKGTGAEHIVNSIVMERSMTRIQKYYFELVRSMCDSDIVFKRNPSGEWETEYTEVWPTAECNPYRYREILTSMNIIERQEGWNLQLFACQVTGLYVPFMVLNADEPRSETAEYLLNEMYQIVWDDDIELRRTSTGALQFTVDPDLIPREDLMALATVVQQVNDLENESLLRLSLEIQDDTGIADPTWMVGNTPVFQNLKCYEDWGKEIDANYALLYNQEVHVLNTIDDVKLMIADITFKDFQQGLGSIFAVCVDPHGDLKPTDSMSSIVSRVLDKSDIAGDAKLSDYTWMNHAKYK